MALFPVGGVLVKVLLVEDDISLAENILHILKTEGHDAIHAADGDEALYHIEDGNCGLVILDRMLPGLSGTEVLKAVRSQNITVPVLILSALGTVDDRITGLDAGADDYLIKPFDNKELLARVRALARRPTPIVSANILQQTDIRLDIGTKELTGPKQSVELTRREGAVLEVLMRAEGEVVQKQVLFNSVWGSDSDSSESNVASYITFLRRRLDAVGSKLQISNHHGVGFSLMPEAKK
jgi:DNA-binding response OmpR family regulator